MHPLLYLDHVPVASLQAFHQSNVSKCLLANDKAGIVGVLVVVLDCRSAKYLAHDKAGIVGVLVYLFLMLLLLGTVRSSPILQEPQSPHLNL